MVQSYRSNSWTRVPNPRVEIWSNPGVGPRVVLGGPGGVPTPKSGPKPTFRKVVTFLSFGSSHGISPMKVPVLLAQKRGPLGSDQVRRGRSLFGHFLVTFSLFLTPWTTPQIGYFWGPKLGSGGVLGGSPNPDPILGFGTRVQTLVWIRTPLGSTGPAGFSEFLVTVAASTVTFSIGKPESRKKIATT